jgi:hypothetical protein
VAEVNGTLIQFTERHVYARDFNFRYTLVSGEAPKKGSKLANDRRLEPNDRDG